MAVTLNVDLGELPDEPEELFALATVANVACGGHAGDGASMRRACARAKAHGVAVTAHPSYPDRAGFGRVAMALPPDVLAAALAAQCAALLEAAAAEGVAVVGVKPHGALYHAVARDRAVAEAAVRGCAAVGGAWMLPPAAILAELVPHAIVEGFADRGYLPDGALVQRGQPGALLEDPAAAATQALALARSGQYQTLCVHGDTRGAVHVARAVRDALASAGLLATRLTPSA